MCKPWHQHFRKNAPCTRQPCHWRPPARGWCSQTVAICWLVFTKLQENQEQKGKSFQNSSGYLTVSEWISDSYLTETINKYSQQKKKLPLGFLFLKLPPPPCPPTVRYWAATAIYAMIVQAVQAVQAPPDRLHWPRWSHLCSEYWGRYPGAEKLLLTEAVPKIWCSELGTLSDFRHSCESVRSCFKICHHLKDMVMLMIRYLWYVCFIDDSSLCGCVWKCWVNLPNDS